jgi:hypothetical protein
MTIDKVRGLRARLVLPLLAVLPLILAGCSQVGTNSLTFWDVIWSLIALFFWFMFIWIFIALFGDIFRRDDLSGWGKAGWILVLVILPFLGALIYIAFRPKVTASDVEMATRAEAASKAIAGVSTADEIAKLTELKNSGAITQAEYETLKAKVLA